MEPNREQIKKRLAMFIEDMPAEFYQEGFAEKFAAAKDEVKEATLHNMIVHAKKLPVKIRTESALWLITHGFHLEV